MLAESWLSGQLPPVSLCEEAALRAGWGDTTPLDWGGGKATFEGVKEKRGAADPAPCAFWSLRCRRTSVGLAASSHLGRVAVPSGQWDEFMALGSSVPDEQLDKVLASLKPNQCCTIIYTSGTTGNPKGVMLSHDNVSACLPRPLQDPQGMAPPVPASLVHR